MLGDGLHEVSDSATVRGRDRHTIGYSKRGKFRLHGIVVDGFRFIRHQQNRFAASSQFSRHGFVLGCEAVHGADDEQKECRLFDRNANLLRGEVIDAFSLTDQPAGVYEYERRGPASCNSILAVASQPRRVCHQGVAGAGQGIEQG